MSYFNGKQWCRRCPSCNKEILYFGKSSKYNSIYGEERGRLCRSCKQTVERHHNFGKVAYNKGVPMSEDQKEKISKSKLGKKRTLTSILKQKEYYKLHGSHRLGKKASEKTLIKMSESLTGRVSPMKGKVLTLEQKEKLSQAKRGKSLTEECKRKLRVSMINYRKSNGITTTNIDKNGPLFFYILNILSEQYGYNFEENYEVKKLGYFVDGYDVKNNIIAEYDSPYHERKLQKEKDKIREYNIINHLNPEEFWRVNEKFGTVKCVYKRTQIYV